MYLIYSEAVFLLILLYALFFFYIFYFENLKFSKNMSEALGNFECTKQYLHNFKLNIYVYLLNLI